MDAGEGEGGKFMGLGSKAKFWGVAELGEVGKVTIGIGGGSGLGLETPGVGGI